MKLDTTAFKFLSNDDFRILSAVEVGMRNHQIVQLDLIHKIAKLNLPLIKKSLTLVHKHKLVFHESKKCNGYRLTFLGYDFLALNAFMKRGALINVGAQIGVGKESDVFLASGASNKPVALKLHRLGRVSFKSIKLNRDYLGKRSSSNWLYISRIAAKKEYDFMQILYDKEYPVPQPFDWNRHCILMEYIDGYPLNNITSLSNPQLLHSSLISLAKALAEEGLIHCDFNEFNILIRENEFKKNNGDDLTIKQKASCKLSCKRLGVVIIDFPQMVSTKHPNASDLFGRDVGAINHFFRKNFGADNIPLNAHAIFSSPRNGDEKNLVADLKRDRDAIARKVRRLKLAAGT